MPAGGPGTRTGQVTCSIHGYEGDFVEATAFCCTLGHGHGNYNYGPGYDTGNSYDSYDSYGGSDDGYDVYDGQVQSENTAGQLPQSAKVKRAGGRKQTVAKAVDNAAAVPEGTLVPAAPAAAGSSSSLGQGQQAVQHVQYLDTNSRPAQQQQQQQWPTAAQRQQQAARGGGGGGGAAAPAPPAAAPATTGMGGFALRRAKRAQSVGGARGAAAVAVAIAADDLDDLQELQAAEQQRAEDQPVWPVAASGELFVSSRAAALREALAKAQ